MTYILDKIDRTLNEQRHSELGARSHKTTRTVLESEKQWVSNIMVKYRWKFNEKQRCANY